jgi:SAM-dependent methyltransferase
MTQTYALGYDDPELARLEHQARMLAPATRTILRLAGVGEGMRVLDLGTGLGDVALAAAELVGPTGEVVGIDREEAMLAVARGRAANQAGTVRFEQGEVGEWTDGRRYDVVLGRLILLYVRDPAAAIRHHLRSLASGGRYVAMEFDIVAARSEPPCPTAARAASLVVEGFRRAGLDPALGTRLGAVLTDAGLIEPTVVGLQAYLPPDDGARAIAGIVATLMPVIEHSGLASADEVGLDTLRERLAAELSAANAVVAMPTLVGAWATT